MIGHTLGHCRIVENIDVEGMGEVSRAHDHQLDSDAALKVLPPVEELVAAHEHRVVHRDFKSYGQRGVSVHVHQTSDTRWFLGMFRWTGLGTRRRYGRDHGYGTGSVRRAHRGR